MALHRFDRQRAQAQDFAARGDGRQQLLGVVGGQDQDGVGRGFLQRLEQGVLRILIRLLKAQEDGHPVCGLVGFQRQAVVDLAHLVDLEHAAFRLRLDDGQVRVLHGLHLLAGAAGSAGFSRRGRVGAEQRARESQCQGAASHTGRTGEQVGVAHRVVRDVLPEQIHRPVVSQQTPVHSSVTKSSLPAAQAQVRIITCRVHRPGLDRRAHGAARFV